MMTPNFFTGLAIYLCVFGISIPCNAADQALLVGIQRYADAQIREVYGAKRDLEAMAKFAQGLGINHITTLFNQQATTQGLAYALLQFTHTTIPGDRILVYYSGHGTQIPDDNGDEADGLDEVWVLYNTSINNADSLHNPWRDDTLAQAIKQLPGREIVVIVDSCHSGSSSKALISQFYSRLLPLPLPTLVARGFERIVNDNVEAEHHLLFTAGPPEQEVYGSAAGGEFTQGLFAVWQQAKSNLTWLALHQAVIAHLKATVDTTHLRIPQLHGPTTLLLQPISPPSSIHTPTAQLQAWVTAAAQDLPITTTQSQYYFGDALRWQTRLPDAGYVLVVAVGPDGQIDQLYPQPAMPPIQQSPGIWAFPASNDAMQLYAGPPVGENQVAIFFHSTPLSLAILQDTGVPAGTWAGITSVWVNAQP